MNKDIQRALITKYRKRIYSKVLNAIETYDLIKPHDKIAVCISGGKDSTLLAVALEEVRIHGNIPFELCFISMNPGYNEENKQKILENFKYLELDVQIFDAPIFQYVKTLDDNPCYMCARMRRGYLYSEAKRLGCNKIALGHHLNDVIETTMLGLLYSNEITFMRPKLRSKNFGGMELIRPLYEVKEQDIIAWRDYHNLEFIACDCPLYKRENDSKRKEVKKIINDMKLYNKEVEDSLFRSIHNLNLSTVVGTRKEDTIKSFNDIYKEEEDARKN